MINGRVPTRPFNLIMENKKILILGIGNTLLGDEGFGVHAVEFLRENYEWPSNIDLLDGGTRGLLLMADLMEHDLVIILDIILAGKCGGTMYLIEEGDLNNSLTRKESAHQTSINDVLTSCELAGFRPEVLVFGLEPFSYQKIDTQLSIQAKELLPVFCDKVVQEMKIRALL